MAILKKRLYRLHFENSALHLARGKEGVYDQTQRVLHSDTLKSALFACALELYGESKITRNFLDGFTISSAFPFAGPEYFFPKPMVRIAKLAGLATEKQGKKLKKIQFLGKSYFEDLLHGREREIKTAHVLGSGEYVTDNALLVNQKEELVLMRAEVQQRLVIPAGYDEDPTPYYIERLHFGPDTGLYFMADVHQPEVLPMLEGALRLLGDNGLGTDRSVGNGHFRFEQDYLEINLPEKASHSLALSLYVPQRAELTEEVLAGSSYNLIKRGGWMASPGNPDNLTLRKRSVYMFTEGSVFANGSQPLTGNLVNLQPEIPAVDHPVWRDGRAMFFPVNPSEA